MENNAAYPAYSLPPTRKKEGWEDGEREIDAERER
jgi:hypothetical protein